jgi:glycerophosphoryl diester phosphodiesterase
MYPDIEERLIALINAYKMADQVIVSSFNHYSMLKIKQLNSKIKVGLLYASGIVDPWKYAKSIGADAIHPIYYNAFIPNLVKNALEAGVEVNFYTVNTVQDIQAILLTSPSSIITNYPDRAISIRDGVNESDNQ